MFDEQYIDENEYYETISKIGDNKMKRRMEHLPVTPLRNISEDKKDSVKMHVSQINNPLTRNNDLMEENKNLKHKMNAGNVKDLEITLCNSIIKKLEKRISMATQFAFYMSDGIKDINNAIGRMIPHPDELPRQFGIDDTNPVKMVWAIYSPDREEWLDKGGYYMIAQNTQTHYSILARTKPKLLKHTIPYFETIDEMFDSYNKWEQRHLGNII